MKEISLASSDSREIIENLGDLNKKLSGNVVLLTGAAGFLGHGFLHYFAELNRSGILEKPCRILAMDTFLRGKPSWFVKLEEEGTIQTVSRSVTDPLEIDHADYVIHGASVASPTFYRKYPVETMDANVQGLRNILEWSREHPVQSVLFFSSSEIYGDPDPGHIPTSEDYWGNVSCTGPRACYDESKRFGETLCSVFYREYDLPVKTVRPFNNYGPGLALEDRRVIPDLFGNILKDEDIVLLSDGRATRTFCYQSDAITGYLLALFSDHKGEAFNIGCESPEISMRDLAALMIQISGKSLEVVHSVSEDKDYLTDNPQRRCPDISKAKKLLGYQVRVGLEEGLKRVYSHYAGQPA